jgi:hypothetical protein
VASFFIGLPTAGDGRDRRYPRRPEGRAGRRSPYFWTVAGNSLEGIGRLREGLIATARIILRGLAMDAVYLGRSIRVRR